MRRMRRSLTLLWKCTNHHCRALSSQQQWFLLEYDSSPKPSSKEARTVHQQNKHSHHTSSTAAHHPPHSRSRRHKHRHRPHVRSETQSRGNCYHTSPLMLATGVRYKGYLAAGFNPMLGCSRTHSAGSNPDMTWSTTW